MLVIVILQMTEIKYGVQILILLMIMTIHQLVLVEVILGYLIKKILNLELKGMFIMIFGLLNIQLNLILI